LLHGLGVVDELQDIALFDPQMLELVDGLAIGQSLGEVDGVDPSG
jgi:hypothetical protein